MAYSFVEARIGLPPIANIDTGTTTANSATIIPSPPATLGMVARAFDPTFGEGEFILLKGVAATAIGSLVIYDSLTYATTLCAVTANQGRPVAVAMSANTSATAFGWYQISGTAVVAKTTSNAIAVSASISVRSTGKVGNITTASGKQVLGAKSGTSVNSAATTVQVVIDRPHLQGQTT